MKIDRKILERALGYTFVKPQLFEHALTHRSFVREAAEPLEANERLEFLGDAVLGFVVTEALFRRFPGHGEGDLTKIKAFLVSAGNLFDVAQQVGLGDYLLLGRGEERTGGRRKKALLVDAFEAVLAAIYLDGGLPAVLPVVERWILTEQALESARTGLLGHDAKSSLQEWLQARQLPGPVYRMIEESGPPHRRLFTIEISIGGLFTGRAQGSTKKTAEQETARLALVHFEAIRPAALDETELTGNP